MAQTGQHLSSECVLGLEGTLDFVSAGYFELDDLLDAQVPQRPEVHEIDNEPGTGLEVVPHWQALIRNKSGEDAKYDAVYICSSVGN